MLAASRTSASRLARRSFATVVESAGVKVSALDAGQPTSSVTLLVKAGPRFENKAGVAHAFKNFAFKSTAKRSALANIRETELYGGVLSTTMTREHIAVTAEFLKGDEEYFVNLLTAFATSSKFTRYELEESVLPTVEAESLAASSDPGTHALELAHALAFRNGLGASLFAPKHSFVTEKDVSSYAARVLSKDNIAFLGTGIDSGLLSKLVSAGLGSASTPAAGAPSASATAYYGGESRVTSIDAPQTLFIGFGQAGAPSAALAALAAHLNPTPAVKWSQGSSPFSDVLPAGATVQSVLLPYSDATLFGLLVQAEQPGVVRMAGEAVVKVLKAAGELKPEQAKAAVAKAKFAAASMLDGRDGLVAALGAKVLSGSDASIESVTAALEKVDAAAVTSAAQSLFKSKPVFVAVGDVNNLPYADELGL